MTPRGCLALLLLCASAACGPTEDSMSDDDDDDAAVDADPGDDDDDNDDDDDDDDDGPDASTFDSCTELRATVRDFSPTTHPDFEPDTASDFSYPGLVEATLGPDGKPVYASDGPTPHTAGPAEFAQWYHDTPGINLTFEIVLPLTETSPGVFVHESDAFFPLDGLGFGNEGNPHNFHFTDEIHTTFTYQGGEVFTFDGDDDLWLFINERLAIDLGGLHPALSATVDLDASAAALGITPGNSYRMDIFHAERHTDASNFHVETTIQCFVIP